MTKPGLVSSCAMGALLVAAILVHGCGSSSGGGSSANLPLITPPVKKATPVGYGGGTSSLQVTDGLKSLKGGEHIFSLTASDIKSRFFSSGPTYIFSLLGLVDGMISAPQGVNGATGACLSQTPVSYNITPFGQTVTMYAQCARSQTASFTGDPAFFQFGIQNNLIYMYAASGIGRVAAIVSPLSSTGLPVATPTIVTTGSTGASPSPSPSLTAVASSYQVELWYGMGYGVPPATGSYGAVHLIANTVTKAFEMTVAGQGFGYCGAQIKSDGTNIYATGSPDMGTTCAATDTLCVAASDGSTAGTCGTSLTTFALPALGRQTSTGPNGTVLGVSQYPGGTSNTVILTGASTDSLWFGPLTITSGVGKL